MTGYTLSANFPTTPGAYDTAQYGSYSDAFVSRIGEPEQAWSTTITYAYDPLYRLTAADYSGGEYFHYTYDAVGNNKCSQWI